MYVPSGSILSSKIKVSSPELVKVLPYMSLSEAGIVIDLSEVQPSKVPSSLLPLAPLIFVTVDGIVIFANAVHWKNAPFPIVVTAPSKTTVVKLLHCLKVEPGITVTPLGIVTEVIPVP